MSTNSFVQWSKASHFQALSDVESAQASVRCAEHRLAARTKLLSCGTSIPQVISTGEQIIHEIQPSSTVSRAIHAPPPSKKLLEVSSSMINVPDDDKTRSLNTKKKQKLCLEIWLPSAHMENDDDNSLESSPSVAIRRTSGTPTSVTAARSSIVSKLPIQTSSEATTVPLIDPPKDSLPTSMDNQPISISMANNRKQSATISRFMQKCSLTAKNSLPLPTNSLGQVHLPLLPDRIPLGSRMPSANYCSNPPTTSIARNPSSIQSSHSNSHSQLRLLCLTNRRLPQYTFSSIPSAVFLTTFTDKKTNDTIPSLQRSRTFQTLADLSSTAIAPPSPFSSPSLNQLRPAADISPGQTSCLVSKRMSFTRRGRR